MYRPQTLTSGSTSSSRLRRTTVSAAAAVLTLSALSACGDESNGGSNAQSEEDINVIAEDVQELRERIDAIDDRVGAIEGTGNPEATDVDPVDLVDNPQDYLDTAVSFQADVSELQEGIDDDNATFLAGGQGGAGVWVISNDPPPELLTTGSLATVVGTVHELDETNFEDTFGMPADEAFANPDEVFDNADRPVAVEAIEIDVAAES
jgi:hypothetical protein